MEKSMGPAAATEIGVVVHQAPSQTSPFKGVVPKNLGRF
jgi:hypothetical protein